MSAYADTYSTTYTIADIGKVFDCFAADFDMVAQSTGLLTRESVRQTSADVKTMAQNSYLTEAIICLADASGKIIRAAKYEISTDASMWTAQRPSNNLWPRTIGGSLDVVLKLSASWRALSDQRQRAFLDNLLGTWGASDIDTSFSHLSRHSDRDYMSNGYGLRKSIYR